MLAYLMLHIQVGMRTQTRTEVAIQSSHLEHALTSMYLFAEIIVKTNLKLIYNET